MLTEYTSFDEIRAVLGVAAEEIEDATLDLPIYQTQLIFALEDVATGVPDAFKVVSAKTYASRTSAEQRLYEVTRIFSAFAIANELLTSLPYFAELKVQDGRAAKERVADPYEKTRAGVGASLADMRIRLSAAYGAVASGATLLSKVTRVWATSAGLALDPVTNV